MSDRDELAKVICDACEDYESDVPYDVRSADAVIAAGWRKKPSKEEVREEWASLLGGLYRNQRYAEFDRMIASVGADAWDEGFIANSMESIDGLGLNELNRDLTIQNLRVAAEARNPYRSEKQ